MQDWMFIKHTALPCHTFLRAQDDMIGVHVFLCIIGMLFYRHLAWKLRKFKLSQRELREKLEGVRVSVIKSRYTKEVKFVVKEMNAQQARLFSALDLWTHMKF